MLAAGEAADRTELALCVFPPGLAQIQGFGSSLAPVLGEMCLAGVDRLVPRPAAMEALGHVPGLQPAVAGLSGEAVLLDQAVSQAVEEPGRVPPVVEASGQGVGPEEAIDQPATVEVALGEAGAGFGVG